MGKNNNLKNAEAVLGIASSIVGLAVAIKPLADDIYDKIAVRESAPDDTVIIPDLYKPGFRLVYEQAEQILNTVGFNSMPTELSIDEAKIRYRNYIPNQVVSTSPKQGSKCTKGSTIVVKYITEDIIAESKRLYEESLEQKVERINKRKDAVNKLTGKAKNLVSKPKMEIEEK